MHLLKQNKTIAILMMIFAFVGFADAAYLAVEHYIGGTVLCGLTGGCDIVTTSVYSKLFGVPVALLGVFYYFSVIFGVVAYLDSKDERFFFWLAHYTAIGFIASMVFVVLQVFLIKSICVYCMGSALSSTLIYYLGHQVHKKHRSMKKIYE